MCDTFVATPGATLHGEMILAKNSDREPNEAQNVTFVPAAKHPRGSMVKCTALEVPQAERTRACLLSRPFWMWGAEMGVNDAGVAIGNEAVFTRERYAKSGLLGMDMLRLALERSASALEALAVIAELLETYGQGGTSGYEKKLYYHNSFLVADPGDAYIMETADKYWAVKKVSGTASISNCLTIGGDWTILSPGLEEYALKRRYLKPGRRLDFARDFSDRLYTHFAKGRVRHSCSATMLALRHGQVTSLDMFSLLRNHNMPEPYRPGGTPMERICMHAGGLVSSQSTGSMVAVLRAGRPPLVYFTGTAAPCLSLFKPHVLGEGQKKPYANDVTSRLEDGSADLYGSAAGVYDERTLWWTGEAVHRRALMNYAELAPEWQAERDELERGMVVDLEERWRGGPAKTLAKTCAAWTERFMMKNARIAEEFADKYRRLSPIAPAWYRLYWKRMNRRAGLVI